MDIKNMTTNQIVQLNQRELMNLTDKELRQAVSVLRSTSRKRYERIEEKEIYSESAIALWKSTRGKGAVFPTIKGMDETQLINEYKRYKGFLTSKTSTVKGARKSQKAKEKVVADITGVELTADDMLKFYSIYDDAKRFNLGLNINYRDIMSMVAETYDANPEWSREKILEQVENTMVQMYEQENPTTPIAIYPSRTM